MLLIISGVFNWRLSTQLKAAVMAAGQSEAWSLAEQARVNESHLMVGKEFTERRLTDLEQSHTQTKEQADKAWAQACSAWAEAASFQGVVEKLRVNQPEIDVRDGIMKAHIGGWSGVRDLQSQLGRLEGRMDRIDKGF